MATLTKRQNELLSRIAQCWESGMAPVVSVLAQEMGYAGQSSITPMLEALQRKELLEIRGGVRGRQRQLRLTAQGKIAVGQGGLPVVGSIAAGPLGEALQQADVFVEQLQDALPFEPGDFLLEVRGDSMIGDGIIEGDRVLLRPNASLYSGEIAAVHVGDEYSATLKHVHFQAGRKTVELRASNPKYEALVLPASQVSVIGAFRGLIRPAPRRSTPRSAKTRR
jgi:repressor LexA